MAHQQSSIFKTISEKIITRTKYVPVSIRNKYQKGCQSLQMSSLTLINKTCELGSLDWV